MLFWAVITGAAALVALVLALAFRRGGSAQGAALAVYRDQLAEIERDLGRSVLTPDEAARARLEVQRRLLEADRAARAAPGLRQGPGAWAGALVGLAVAGGAVGLYAWLGAPGYPDLPRQLRLELSEQRRAARPGQEQAEQIYGAAPPAQPQAEAEFLALMEQLRAAVAERPGDLQGWTLLARNEAALGNLGAAWRAQAHVLRLKGERATAEDYASQAEMMIAAAGGFVSPEAEVALTRALQKDARQPMARYLSGLMFAQIDRPDLAFRLWQPLLAEGPPDAPWVAPIRAEIEAVAAMAGIRDALPPADAGIADLTEEERATLIRGMVEGLAERLASEGGPAEDWARLISSLRVLGEDERARAIAAEAETVFAADPAGLAAVRDAAQGLP